MCLPDSIKSSCSSSSSGDKRTTLVRLTRTALTVVNPLTGENSNADVLLTEPSGKPLVTLIHVVTISPVPGWKVRPEPTFRTLMSTLFTCEVGVGDGELGTSPSTETVPM